MMIPESHCAVNRIALLMWFCCVAPAFASTPAKLTFRHVLIDNQPPRNPWIKIVGDLNGDGRLDVVIGGSKGPLVWYRNPDWKKSVIATAVKQEKSASVFNPSEHLARTTPFAFASALSQPDKVLENKPRSAETAKTKRHQPAMAPYPHSREITGIEWAPTASIVRRARRSDNWPITWADDDNLYAAYGDGRGCEPYIDVKLSMGLCRISGSAEEFLGLNLRSPSCY